MTLKNLTLGADLGKSLNVDDLFMICLVKMGALFIFAPKKPPSMSLTIAKKDRN